jgi:hypothetical protein
MLQPGAGGAGWPASIAALSSSLNASVGMRLRTRKRDHHWRPNVGHVCFASQRACGLGYRAGKSDTPLLAEGAVRLWRTFRATKFIYVHERNAVVPDEGTLTKGRSDPIGKRR